MRLAIAIAVVCAAAIFYVASIEVGLDHASGSLLLNLSSEVLGIAVTVAVIEYLLERARRRDDAARIAHIALDEIDHAVWVWQGGQRAFRTDELMTLLRHVTDDDPLPDFTQNLFLRVGGRAGATLRVSEATVNACAPLKQGLTQVAALAAMRDADQMLTPREIAAVLVEGCHQLLLAARLPAPSEAHLEVRPNADPLWQEWRHFGGDGPPPEVGSGQQGDRS